MSAAAQEFNISVTPLGTQDEYLVRTEWVAPGVPLAEEQVRWPVEDWLAKAKQLMNDPLLGLLQGSENILSLGSSMDLVTFGEELYDALFQKSLLNSWERAQGIAENRQTVLRLRLGLKGAHLPRLPWEVLHAGDRPLATGTDVAFSRYELTTGLRGQPLNLSSVWNQPLKILMVIAGPSDQETLELKQEASQLQEELRQRSYNGAGPIQLQILEQPGREQLTQALEQGHYQIFHYSGHSNLGAAGGDLYMVSSKTGLTETLNGDDLAGLLVNNGVQMAVFNSCRSAYTASEIASENGREQNLIQALVKRRIPGVLAMAERIPDGVALTLTRLFYRNLSQGYPIDLSLGRARQGLISAYGSHQLYWALPVLYLDPKFDGFLMRSPDVQELEKRLALSDASEVWDDEEALFTTSTASHQSSNLDYEEQVMMGVFEDLEPADQSYEDDLAVVSELFRQVSNVNASTDTGSQTQLPPTAEKHSVSLVNVAGSTDSIANSQQPTIIQEDLHPQSKLRVSGQPPVQPSQAQPRLKAFPFQWFFGATGILAIALLGWWFFHRSPQPQDLLPPIPAASVPNFPKGDLKQADTASVTAFAIQQFDQGNIGDGTQAVEELLKPERNALKDADAALAAVPQQLSDNNPEISFLHGRVAWQSAQQPGNQKYSVDDAQRYWEYAVKKQPNNPRYLTALGFSYYAQGEFKAAYEAWVNALNQTSPDQTATAAATTPSVTAKEVLNIYAGLALGLSKSAQKPDKQAKLLSTALQYRQKVIMEDPVDFQPDALSKNWLWTEKAIQDWKALLQQQVGEAPVTPVLNSGGGKNTVTKGRSPSKNGHNRNK